MVARVATVAFQGIEVLEVDVQVQIGAGMPGFALVGLPDKAVGESRERVRAALGAIGLALPPKRITVNLAPADLLKEGSHFDLPIAPGLLTAMGVLPAEEMAMALAFRLQKLEAMRKAVEAIQSRPQLKRDVFTRGDPEATVIVPSDRIDASLYELMAAYVTQRRREELRRYNPGQRVEAFQLEAARDWLTRYAMLSPERAELVLKSIEASRSYAINYNVGRDLVKQYVERRAGPGATLERRWEVFLDLLASPRLPSDLR